MTDALMKKASILVVDDDPTLRLLTRAALEQVGFDVIEAENGQVAVDVATTALPDMIMLDVEMPVLDGFSACAEIRKHEEFVDTPIVMLTGRDDERRIGAEGVVEHPHGVTQPAGDMQIDHAGLDHGRAGLRIQ